MVSMRPIKSTDFGTQLIGRILRVHKRLQGRELPPLLRHGYLFLADHDSQAGISTAAEKINQLKSQLTQTSPFVMLTKVGGEAEPATGFQQPADPVSGCAGGRRFRR
jgi:type III restriction enzyme